MAIQVERARGLKLLAFSGRALVHWNLSTPVLTEIAVRQHEGQLAAEGPLRRADGSPYRTVAE